MNQYPGLRRSALDVVMFQRGGRRSGLETKVISEDRRRIMPGSIAARAIDTSANSAACHRGIITLLYNAAFRHLDFLPPFDRRT